MKGKVYMLVRRGEIWQADLGVGVGSEQGGVRPVLITQNDVGNIYSPTVIAAAITSQKKKPLPTHYSLNTANSGLPKDSIVMMEQIRTIDKQRLLYKIGYVDIDQLSGMNGAIAISQGLITVAMLKNKQSICFV